MCTKSSEILIRWPNNHLLLNIKSAINNRGRTVLCCYLSYCLLFTAHVYWGRKIIHSTRGFLSRWLANWSFLTSDNNLSGKFWPWKDLIIKIKQNCTSKNATETLEFLETEKMRFLAKKTDGFLRGTSNSFKIVKSAQYAVECVSNDIISWKRLFQLIYEVLRQKKSDFFLISKNLKRTNKE